MRKTLRILRTAIIAVMALCFLTASYSFAERKPGGNDSRAEKRVGISWRENIDGKTYRDVLTAIRMAGGKPVQLDMVMSADLKYKDGKLAPECIDDNGMLKAEYAELVKKNGWKGSNVEEVVGDIGAFVFTGGADISTTLYAEPAEWLDNGTDRSFEPERDVSDYLLMRYCIDRDLPVLAICRGEQMLGVVSGAKMIQDIPTELGKVKKLHLRAHRMPEMKNEADRDFAAHDVTVTDPDSLLMKIVGSDKIRAVPSWHHQAIGSVEGTPLKVTAVSAEDSSEVIEAIERTDKTFALGVQFHPEAAIGKHERKEKSESGYMDRNIALKFFKAITDLS